MSNHLKVVDRVPHQRFEFDYDHNAVSFQSRVIHLSPHEADILHLLLKNRARVTPMSALIQGIYGVREPDTAAVSIRVAIHSLRKKLAATGIKIKAEARVGYEIDVRNIPELNLGLREKILSAVNVAQASGEREAADRLQVILVELAMKRIISPTILAVSATVASAQDAPVEKGDAAAGYYGNTMSLVNVKTGALAGITWYNKDGTYQNMRNGKPGSGTYVINDGQDSKTICLSHHDPNGIQTFCHPFDGYKKVGDTWQRQEKLGLMQVTMVAGHI